MITPLDIQNRDFGKSLRGYNEREVDEFLSLISETLERHINENLDLKEKIENVRSELSKYKTLEKTLSDTLVVAKKTADEVIKTSDATAKNIVDKAEIDAKNIINTAKNDASKIRDEYTNMQKDMQAFQIRFKSLLKSQLEVVSNYDVDLE